MTTGWGDLNARARGLGTHLLDEARLRALARAPDLAALAQGLREAGFEPDETDAAGPRGLERAVRRRAAGRFARLTRWCGRRADVLAVLYGDEDRRSIRALLRGAAQGAAADARLAGLLPTPDLPERALRELAAQPTITALAALLVAWRHPFGSALLAEASSPHPDLFRLERSLNRAWAARALRAARRAGRRGPLVAYVRQAVDLANVLTALALAGADRDCTPKDLFLPGGARVSIASFERAVAAGSLEAAADVLAGDFAGTPIGSALSRHAADPEGALLDAQLAMLAARRRLDPLGPAPLLHYALRQRAELTSLRRVIWGVALGAPPAVRQPVPGAA